MSRSAKVLVLVALFVVPRTVQAVGFDVWKVLKARSPGIPVAVKPGPSHFAARTLDVLKYPPAWQGIWEIQTTLRDCTTHDTVTVAAMTDTLCSGEAMSQLLECSGTVSDTHFDFTCTSSFTVLPGCVSHTTMHGVGDRSGDGYTSITTMTTTYAGDCSFPGSCLEQVVTATRTGPAPAGCATPVEVMTWGRIKARFGR